MINLNLYIATLVTTSGKKIIEFDAKNLNDAKRKLKTLVDKKLVDSFKIKEKL